MTAGKIKVTEAAALLHVSDQFVRIGMQARDPADRNGAENVNKMDVSDQRKATGRVQRR